MKAFLFLAFCWFAVNDVLGQSIRFSVRIQQTGMLGQQAVSFDDAEQVNSSTENLTEDDLSFGWNGFKEKVFVSGFRFRDIQIPQGAKIDSAWIEFYCDDFDSDPAFLEISAEFEDSTLEFNNDSAITERAKTSAKVSWNILEEWIIWTRYSTPDISSIVQEIVNRVGWKEGNAISIIIAGQDRSPEKSYGYRSVESFENIEDPVDGGDGLHHPERIPKLVVYYSNPLLPLPERLMSRGINPYPNPVTQDELSLYFEGKSFQNKHVQIIDMNGREVLLRPLERVVNISSLPRRAMYFLRVVEEGETFHSSKIFLE